MVRLAKMANLARFYVIYLRASVDVITPVYTVEGTTARRCETDMIFAS